VIRSDSVFSSKQIQNLANPILKIHQSFFYLLVILILLFLSCSPTKRFTEKEEGTVKTEKDITPSETSTENVVETKLDFSVIRVSMQGLISAESLILESPANLSDEETNIAIIEDGSKITCTNNSGEITLDVNGEEFVGEKFFLTSANGDGIVKLDGKRYRGTIQFSSSGTSIDIINIVNLEEYVRGVIAKEMPLGKNEENLEALKALAVCVRTYAIQKMKDGKLCFDIYADTRDQVYGGVDAEQPISNKAADETRDMILKYDDEFATVFYHSTCGGYTASAQNVFTSEEIPYLVSVQDGSGPNCIISPRFEWEETYTRDKIIERLKNYSLLDNKYYILEDVSVLSRFSSGRVYELEIVVEDENGEEKIIALLGNEIRSVLRTANNKSILWSTLFDVELSSNEVIISGKGFGHGVGMCQWGAISLSQNGWDYEQILELYYPGTEIGSLND
jgi:stage II sporulation protein D